MKTVDHFWHVLLVVYVRHGWVEYLWAGGNNLWIIRHDKGTDPLHNEEYPRSRSWHSNNRPIAAESDAVILRIRKCERKEQKTGSHVLRDSSNLGERKKKFLAMAFHPIQHILEHWFCNWSTARFHWYSIAPAYVLCHTNGGTSFSVQKCHRKIMMCNSNGSIHHKCIQFNILFSKRWEILAKKLQ